MTNGSGDGGSSAAPAVAPFVPHMCQRHIIHRARARLLDLATISPTLRAAYGSCGEGRTRGLGCRPLRAWRFSSPTSPAIAVTRHSPDRPLVQLIAPHRFCTGADVL